MTESTFEPLKLTISISQKVNVGQYENADCSLYISGVTTYSTEAEIAELVEKGKVAYRYMAARVHAMAQEAKAQKGWGAENDHAPPDEPIPFEEPAPPSLRERLGVPAQQPQQPTSDAPVCFSCGGKVWDNRADKPSAKSPDFKCRSRQCGAAAWVNKDGSLYWKAGSAA